jgi:hypothetical protein
VAKNKTTETKRNPVDFINTVEDDQKREDCLQIMKIFKSVTKQEPVMWGTAIVGFGSYHYKYDSGHEGDAPLAGFSPRSKEIVLYLSSVFDNRNDLLKKFGKHKTGKACIYIKKLEDVDTGVLKEMISESMKYMKKKYS